MTITIRKLKKKLTINGDTYITNNYYGNNNRPNRFNNNYYYGGNPYYNNFNNGWNFVYNPYAGWNVNYNFGYNNWGYNSWGYRPYRPYCNNWNNWGWGGHHNHYGYWGNNNFWNNNYYPFAGSYHNNYYGYNGYNGYFGNDVNYSNPNSLYGHSSSLSSNTTVNSTYGSGTAYNLNSSPILASKPSQETQIATEKPNTLAKDQPPVKPTKPSIVTSKEDMLGKVQIDLTTITQL